MSENTTLAGYRVDFVVPVYNEAENFKALYSFVTKHVHSDWHILVVYDFPEDTTLTVAKSLAETDPRIQLVLNSNRGVLNAVKAGLDAATCEAVFEVMADDPESIFEKADELVQRFYDENATIAVASRYMKGGKHIGGPKLKGLLSYTAGVSLYWLIGLPTHDATYNTRIYRKSFLQGIIIESDRGFEIALEITLKAYLQGKKIIEIPVWWQERTVGTSRFNLRKWVPAYAKWYWFVIRTHYGF